MQSPLTSSSSLLQYPLPTITSHSQPLLMIASPHLPLPASRFASLRSNSQAVNYNSAVSVFPAEACDTVGGDACLAEMRPEVKLEPEAEAEKPRVASEAVEREYLDYTDPRTVLLGEACDVLGGEFCEQKFQEGIC